MFPFWDVAVWPLVRAAGARRIVEIGALRGETTVLMLEDLDAAVELHVIDPVPEFDPTEHERRFPGRYIFHRALSHDVLPGLPAVDVALIDGDHNYFTVFHELRLLAEAARRADRALPVLVLHDVGWPYGRRDLYYNPDTVPPEGRRPFAQRGIVPGRSELADHGGVNPLHYNALIEGGPENGVMTALDDFLAGFDRPVRSVVLPVYYGLAIVVEEARIAEHPEIGRVLDELEGPVGKNALLEMTEDARIQAILFQHNEYYGGRDKLARAATRYLDLLSSALLDELYLDHEIRLQYLIHCLRRGIEPDAAKLRDPVREMQLRWEPWVEQRRNGPAPDSHDEGRSLPYAAMGRRRLEAVDEALSVVRNEKVIGDLIDLGTGRGGAAMYMRGYLDAHEIPNKRVWVADRFRVEPAADDPLDVARDLNTVRDGFDRFGLLDERVRFLLGEPAATLSEAPITTIAMIRIGPGLGAEIGAALDAIYPRIAFGGIVMIDAYDDPATRAAVDEFRNRRGIDDPLERRDWGVAVWRKRRRPGNPTAPLDPAPARVASVRAPSGPAAKDLSVIVVFHNMRREAERTLHSLSRAYQRDIDDLDYEVIALDNGSACTEALSADFVESFGPEFRLVSMGADATPTPVDALHRGLSLAAGRVVCFMIDGAHVLTPGVLRHALAGIRTYAPSIVVTQQWYVGPGQQPDAMQSGYDQTGEDELFRTIEWPTDGYRLFDIGHFIGKRDWFDGLWESNCIFVPRELLEQYGAFDERFSMPGGGYANLELYERLGGAPDVTVVTILGEGSFHQVHGGTTTNVADPDDRRATIAGFADHFRELYGRPFRGPGKPLHYVGTMFPRALRTRARRMTAEAFLQARGSGTEDGPPTSPVAMPDELVDGFVDAYWKSLAWQHTRWLGHRIPKAPTDLWVYQELLERVRPEVVIETGAETGGRALFLASVCELLGNGRVIAIDAQLSAERARHPRVDYVEGIAQDPETVAAVRALAGPDSRALVILGSRPGTNLRIEAEFEAYHGFVRAGSYVIVEHTVLNGRPVWPGFGPGPDEAVRRILANHSEFAADTTVERHGLTFNPGGFLKKLREA
jgi:cephalosporin hydroxylase